MHCYQIVVYGMPAPQGSKSFKGMFKGKDGRPHAILAESSKKVKPWRQDVVAAGVKARQELGLPPLDFPLMVTMSFTLPKPSSAPKTKRTYPMRMPDLSKLIRSTEDALVDAGVIVDDARIVCIAARKVYPSEDSEALDSPGCVIRIVQWPQL